MLFRMPRSLQGLVGESERLVFYNWREGRVPYFELSASRG